MKSFSDTLSQSGAPLTLVIAPTNAIHTFFMRFAIDVAFVARDGRVLKVRRGRRGSRRRDLKKIGCGQFIWPGPNEIPGAHRT